MNFKFYQYLNLHVITPIWPEISDATYPVTIVLGVFISAIFMSTEKRNLYLFNPGKYRKMGKVLARITGQK